jgi:hypothetical protein
MRLFGLLPGGTRRVSRHSPLRPSSQLGNIPVLRRYSSDPWPSMAMELASPPPLLCVSFPSQRRASFTPLSIPQSMPRYLRSQADNSHLG